MKTILLLTDFSINADYAAQYALKLAQKLEANLLLCNVYTVAEDEVVKDQRSWPLSKAQEESRDDLMTLAAMLNKLSNNDSSKNGFRPEISQCSKEGSLSDTIKDIASSQQVLMAVLSMHNAKFLSVVLQGNHALDIIENATFPVLVIPYQVRFKAYKLIAFATAMNYSDINVLESLSGLAKLVDSKILIAHVTDEITDNAAGGDVVKQFFNQIPLKLKYPKILYRVIKGSSVVERLNWLTTNVDIDLMVLVYHKRNFFQKLFDKSVVQKLALHPTKPLLIFPCAKVQESLPVF